MPNKDQVGEWAQGKGLIENAKDEEEVEPVEWGYQIHTKRGCCIRIYHTNWISVTKANDLDIEALSEISIINPNPPRARNRRSKK